MPTHTHSHLDPRTQDILYESEAALRMVDQQLDQLQEEQGEYRALLHRATPRMSNALLDVPLLLQQANEQISAVLTRLRESRAALEHTTTEKLSLTKEKLRQVNSATEDAATNILDACDRATALVDRLDAIDEARTADKTNADAQNADAQNADAQTAEGAAARSALRDELFLMMTALQFQDITSQQLGHASAVLVEMEERLLKLASLFDFDGATESLLAELGSSYHDSAFAPSATMSGPDARQAIADEIFTAIKVSAA